MPHDNQLLGKLSEVFTFNMRRCVASKYSSYVTACFSTAVPTIQLMRMQTRSRIPALSSSVMVGLMMVMVPFSLVLGLHVQAHWVFSSS